MDSSRHDGATLVTEFRFIRRVRDLAAHRSFYAEVFAWPVADEWDEGVMFDTGTAIFELIQDIHAELPNESSSVSLSVPDARSLFELVKDRAAVAFPPRDNPWGDTSFRIKDPDGFLITLFTPIT